MQLALRLEALVFAPGEVLPCGKLYIVNRGLAIYAGKLLGTGKVWGEQDVIIDNQSLRHNLCARSLNFLEVFAIDRFELDSVAQAFPEVARGIRRIAVRFAARRAFVRYAKRVRAERDGRKVSVDRFAINEESDVFVRAAVPVPKVTSPGALMPSQVQQELQRQGARQEALAETVQQLVHAVNALRSELLPPPSMGSEGSQVAAAQSSS